MSVCKATTLNASVVLLGRLFVCCVCWCDRANLLIEQADLLIISTMSDNVLRQRASSDAFLLKPCFFLAVAQDRAYGGANGDDGSRAGASRVAPVNRAPFVRLAMLAINSFAHDAMLMVTAILYVLGRPDWQAAMQHPDSWTIFFF